MVAVTGPTLILSRMMMMMDQEDAVS